MKVVHECACMRDPADVSVSVCECACACVTGTWAAQLQPSPHDATSCDDHLCPDKELDPERPVMLPHPSPTPRAQPGGG